MKSAAKPHPVYAVVGAAPFLRHELLHSVLESLSAEMDPLGPTRPDGDTCKLADVLDEVRTASLLGDRRVVVVDNADGFITANRPALEKYCAEPYGGGTLIFVCDSFPKTTRLHKIITANGAILTCEPPKGRSIVTWLGDRAQQVYDKRLSAAVAERLRDQVGEDLGRLDGELAKLAAYVGQRSSITEADVGIMSGATREEKVFAVTNSMADGNAVEALENWRQVWATDRAAPGRAIAGLAWSVRQLLDARRDFEAGVRVGELSRRLYADPAIVERRLKNATVSSLRRQQQDLLNADLAIKTGISTAEVSVEKFIVKNTNAR